LAKTIAKTIRTISVKMVKTQRSLGIGENNSKNHTHYKCKNGKDSMKSWEWAYKIYLHGFEYLNCGAKNSNTYMYFEYIHK